MPARGEGRAARRAARLLRRPGGGATRFPRAGAAVAGEPAHVALARHADLVFVLYRTLPPVDARVVRRWVGEMIAGMRKFVLLYPHGIRIQTRRGVQGVLLLRRRHGGLHAHGPVARALAEHRRRSATSVLRERCRAFAEALQTVNILKDVAHDAEQENSIYVPEELLRAHGSARPRLLPALRSPRNRGGARARWCSSRGTTSRARAATCCSSRGARCRSGCSACCRCCSRTRRCATSRARRDARPGALVKISRREVRALLAAAPLVVGSNAMVRWLMRRVRRAPFGPFAPRPT